MLQMSPVYTFPKNNGMNVAPFLKMMPLPNMTSRVVPKKKLTTARKACKLEDCSKILGDCMHCTCDGSCGQHEGGKCGDRREGSGPACKKADCSKDDECTHSTRASCCKCRNMVYSTRHRSVKTSTSRMDVIKALNGMPVASQSQSQTKRRKECATEIKEAATFFKPARPMVLASERDFSMNPEWSSRQAYANLTVVVEGSLYQLHKFPLLLQSKALHRAASHSSLIQIHECPGGSAIFEQLVDVCYSGNKLVPNLENAGALFCAARFLEMDHLVSELQVYFQTRVFSPPAPEGLQKVFSDVLQLGPMGELHARSVLARCVHELSSASPSSITSLETLTPFEFEIGIEAARHEGVEEFEISQFTASFTEMYLSTSNINFLDKCSAACHLMSLILCQSAVTTPIAESLHHTVYDLLSGCNELTDISYSSMKSELKKTYDMTATMTTAAAY